jgi:threonine synthase
MSEDTRIRTDRAWLTCLTCGSEYGMGETLNCRREDGGILDVSYASLWPTVTPPAASGGFWAAAAALPPVAEENRITLGEGGTPLVSCDVDGIGFWVKDEGRNPAGAFKARFSAVNVSVARELGYRAVALSSTGNAGLTAGAYAAAAGLSATVYLPEHTPAPVLDSLRLLGAAVVTADRAAHEAMLAADLAGGAFPASRGMPFRSVTPYGAEGYKTIAYELAGQVPGPLTDVYLPLGGGDGAYGVAKGFAELVQAALIERMPRIHGVQTRSAVARSIADDEVGNHAVSALRRSGGGIITVTDQELRDAMGFALRRGLLPDPSSVASLAGRLKAPGLADGQSACIVTGELTRWSSSVSVWLLGERAAQPAE